MAEGRSSTHEDIRAVADTLRDLGDWAIYAVLLVGSIFGNQILAAKQAAVGPLRVRPRTEARITVDDVISAHSAKNDGIENFRASG